ncbi:MAG: HAMP domain-containing protein [Saprospiraceae bacterium]|nr:HAMP domain-containing protein [Saprospiraceae bacterium]
MKIKAKLTLGVGLLFILIILLAALGTLSITVLNKDTQNILVANYNTLEYTRSMLLSLDEDLKDSTVIKTFTKHLALQQNNITEIGEEELTNKLSMDFNRLVKNPQDPVLYRSIRKDLTDIMLLNMQAIERKSNVAKETAKLAAWWIPLIGTLCFLIAFILLVNLPGNIANPIQELTESIKQVAAKNYTKRVGFEGHNEFGELANAFNVMTQKLQEYENSKLSKILFEKKRIETLINKMHDPVIGLDENKVILFANDEAIKIIGLKPDQIIGKNAKDLALVNDLIRSLMKELISTELPQIKVIEKSLKIFADNKESYFDKEIIEISIIPTGELVSKHIGHVILLKNITPFKELDSAKTHFMATVSHEFKTPIAAIKMSLQLLENEQIGILNPEQKNLLESIKEDAHRLLKITGEMLDMTQVESGNIQLSIFPTSAKEILLDAIHATKIPADQKQIKFEINIQNNLPNVQADTEKTTWVLTNLLSNAIRYSYENSTIYARIKYEDGSIKFAIKDTGPGIAPQYKDKVFDRYFRVPGSNKEGTGLGLAISKEFIEAQGGNITIDSEYGTGSTFIVSLKSIA